jgi:2-hydroxy-6-oxonona-2,4-dienedioate hydrolase
VKENYVDVAGVRTRYLEAGSGEPFVLVHGGEFGRISNANAWDMVVDRLAEKGFHVYALDKIGNGFTDHPERQEDLVIGATVDHVWNFVQALKIGPAHIAGHSRGGYTVTQIALEHPDWVKTLVIVSSGTVMARFNPIYEQWNQEAAKINDPRERLRYQNTANSCDPSHITEAFLDLQLRITDLPATQETKRRMVGGARKVFLADVAKRQAELVKGIQAGGIKAPTIVTWGLNDPSASFDPVGIAAIQLFLPNAPKAESHVFANCGHYVFREKAAEWTEVVSGYIARSR